ncbi:MAG: thioredoxin [Bacilli bacterium]|nr:thioredoxin [Bacilli bacterium]
MKELNNDSFTEKVLKAKGKVLVDFNANWCGPCKVLKPVLEELLKDYTIYSVNVDKNEELSASYDVMSIPCLLLFEDGKLIKRSVGMTSKENIIEMFEGK